MAAHGGVMARYDFYEVRSARNEEAERDDAGGVLHRRSYICAERSDLNLFVWMGANEELEALQLLFREHFVSWSRQAGVTAGVTSRHQCHPRAESRVQGVRTLHETEAVQGAAILAAARQVLAQSELPASIDGAVRRAFA